MSFVDQITLEDNRYPLRHRVAVITGAESGIGAATAAALHARGAAVALLGLDGRRLEEQRSRLPGDGLSLAAVADVTDRHALSRARRHIMDSIGVPDLVVSNAGVMNGGPLRDADVHDMTQMIEVNVLGMLHTAQLFLPDLEEAAAGSRPSDLIFIGSIAGEVLFPNFSVYGASQAAIAQLARTLRAEIGPNGVRVKLVEAGVTLTRLGKGISDRAARRELEDLREIDLPLTPDEVADAVAFSATLPPHVNLSELTVVPTKHGRLGAV
ncbi:SDR family oxidoreductase [Arthrobacter sp. NamB2]|uniref:SDR family oxidoreductase n=1 Tax=Arthrobacter sp. NamB2 TaxID=2576035 RepID=UPI0010C94E57|nr:SDR family oxidoreductase [Arthrobacter sp. NamB2]TKV27401.1 SDR family oxidoreductase [Arthrobacter sp. NamB2]